VTVASSGVLLWNLRLFYIYRLGLCEKPKFYDNEHKTSSLDDIICHKKKKMNISFYTLPSDLSFNYYHAPKYYSLVLHDVHSCCNSTVSYQYSETNVMHFVFNLLRIKGLCMFRALLAQLHEDCTNGTWYVYCMRVMSVSCTLVQLTDITHVGFTILIYYDARSTKH
jgi:hypothetical protein